MSTSTAARVEARLNELKAEIAKLRGFVETVASQSAAPYTSPAANLASMGSWMQRLVDEALELLAEIDDKED